MIDYIASLQAIIATGEYALGTLEDRIDRLWLEGKLTTEQRDELRQAAAEGAKDEYQTDIFARLADHEDRIYKLEHPTDIYPVWTPGRRSNKGEVLRFDVTGDGEYDLVRYDGGRQYTDLSIGKIEGWHMLDLELEPTHNITRDADGGYVLTPIEPEAE